MAGETIVLDPTAVATGRTQLDITSYVAAAGPNWGDAEIQAYMADQQVGSTTIDYRLPNRTITIPLNLRTLGATTFATIRSSLEQKVALFQRQQGQIMRQVGATPLYADVQSATLHLGGAWLQAYRDVDVDAVLTLECVPDWYGDEIILTTHTETTLPHLFFTEATINGNYPGRTRLITTNGTAVDQHGLLWGLRSRYYNAGTTAALFYEAEAPLPMNAAAMSALAGASGGTVITQGTLPANVWVPILSTSMVSGTIPLTHTGSYRVWARCYSASANPQYRLLWGNGALSLPTTNDTAQLPASGNFYVLDLGEARLDAPPVGPSQWSGVVQAKAVQGGPASIDCIWLQPLDDGAGKLGYTPIPSPAMVASGGFPGAGADDSGTGTIAWTNTGNIFADDGLTASASLTVGATSHYLKATSFGFSVPSTATIQGITVAIKRWAQYPGTIYDSAVRLVKAGTVQTSDLKVTTAWNTYPPQTWTFGSPTDLWGASWAPSDVINSGFGAALAAIDSSLAAIASIEFIEIAVWYTLSSGFTIAPRTPSSPPAARPN